MCKVDVPHLLHYKVHCCLGREPASDDVNTLSLLCNCGEVTFYLCDNVRMSVHC